MANQQSLVGKLVSQIVIKSDGDVFHEIFRERTHHVSDMSPAHIQNVELHEGDWGKVGSVLLWNYTHDEKQKVAKEVVEVIDEANKLVKYRIVEGDVLKLYNTVISTVHVETKGENNLVTWTLEYEKKNSNIPDPHSIMEFLINITKDIEAHHLK